MGIFKEFREFAMRGNVVDMAIGIVIGAAFGRVVTSLVNEIVMPPIGLLIGGVDFNELKFTLRDAVIAADGTVEQAAVTIGYGTFLNTVIDFVIVAAAIFMVIRLMNTAAKRFHHEKQAEAPPPAPPREEVLLGEIRDQLVQLNRRP